ncbi:MAG: CarD family transcriptional regulator [Holosporales bacterium]|jgi:CarD family transcriptional regulator|nr:CarD family transcriptional regulator [Holosporales bacterium]
MEKIDFEIGSWVVYPLHGVGKLDNIDVLEIDGQSTEFFIISFPKNKLILKIPINRAIGAGLRKVTTKKTMKEALDILVQKAKKKRMMWSKRALEYETKINSGDPILIAEVIRDLYKGEGDTVQSFSERQIYQDAMERLAREFSIIEKIGEEEAVKKLEILLKAA